MAAVHLEHMLWAQKKKNKKKKKGYEVTGGGKKLHNEELNDLYCSPSIILSDFIQNNGVGGGN